VGATRVLSEDLPAAADVLAREGVRGVYADYWLAYPLQYLSGGRLVVAPLAYDRFPDGSARVAADPAAAFAAPVGPPADALQAALERRGSTFRRRDVGSVALFTGVSPRQTPASLGILVPWSFGDNRS
jgi:hypothetical protein